MTTMALGGYEHFAAWDSSFRVSRRYLWALTLIGVVAFGYDCSWCWWCIECLIF